MKNRLLKPSEANGNIDEIAVQSVKWWKETRPRCTLEGRGRVTCEISNHGHFQCVRRHQLTTATQGSSVREIERWPVGFDLSKSHSHHWRFHGASGRLSFLHFGVGSRLATSGRFHSIRVGRHRVEVVPRRRHPLAIAKRVRKPQAVRRKPNLYASSLERHGVVSHDGFECTCCWGITNRTYRLGECLLGRRVGAVSIVEAVGAAKSERAAQAVECGDGQLRSRRYFLNVQTL